MQSFIVTHTNGKDTLAEICYQNVHRAPAVPVEAGQGWCPVLGGVRAFDLLREQQTELTAFASHKVRLLPGVRAWRPRAWCPVGPVKAGCPTQVCSYA